MPHKKNPILSENLCGIARLLRSYANAALEDVALWHERDISHFVGRARDRTDATGLADFMVRRAAGLVDGLVVNAPRMRENLDQAKGLYFSEAVMLTLVRKGMARQAAYELVQRNALRAVGRRGGVPRPAGRRQGHLGAPGRGGHRPRLQPRTPPAPRRRDHRQGPGGGIFMSKSIDETVIRAQLDKTLEQTNFPSSARSTRARCATATCATASAR
jgi:hypothetical protein